MRKRNANEIFNYCPNYDCIINSINDDDISNDLIDKYKEIVFSMDSTNMNHIEKLYKLDKIMYQYVEDYYFKRSMKEDIIKKQINIKEGMDHNDFIYNVFEFDSKYEEELYKNFETTVWV